MSNIVGRSADPEPVEILAVLERCLADLDRLELTAIAAQLSSAIETLRGEVLARTPDRAASRVRGEG